MGTDHYTCDICNDICNWFYMCRCKVCETMQCDQCTNLKYYEIIKDEQGNMIFKPFEWEEDENQSTFYLPCENCHEYFNLKNSEQTTFTNRLFHKRKDEINRKRDTEIERAKILIDKIYTGELKL